MKGAVERVRPKMMTVTAATAKASQDAARKPDNTLRMRRAPYSR